MKLLSGYKKDISGKKNEMRARQKKGERLNAVMNI
jgi:hypothetical protein